MNPTSIIVHAVSKLWPASSVLSRASGISMMNSTPIMTPALNAISTWRFCELFFIKKGRRPAMRVITRMTAANSVTLTISSMFPDSVERLLKTVHDVINFPVPITMKLLKSTGSFINFCIGGICPS